AAKAARRSAGSHGVSTTLPSGEIFQPWKIQRSPPCSLRPSAIDALRCGQASSMKPTRPSVARNATKFSPMRRTRFGAPKRVRLMGENFVAFRATDGRVGFIDEACPHRSASMALGRNEQGGLRCIFHGWKISPEGKVVDTPCEPADRRAAFAAAQKVRALPTH